MHFLNSKLQRNTIQLSFGIISHATVHAMQYMQSSYDWWMNEFYNWINPQWCVTNKRLKPSHKPIIKWNCLLYWFTQLISYKAHSRALHWNKAYKAHTVKKFILQFSLTLLWKWKACSFFSSSLSYNVDVCQSPLPPTFPWAIL